MDSWSRPSKHQATPAPFYLLPGGEATPYCHACGRVISSRRTAAEKTTATTGNNNSSSSKKRDTTDTPSPTVVKYCSSRCRSHKPGKLDREIESVFVGLLNGTVGGREVGEGGGGGGSLKRERTQKTKKAPGGGGAGGAKKKIKGDARILVSCDEVERQIFGHENDGDTAGSVSSSSPSGSQHGDKEEIPTTTTTTKNGRGDATSAQEATQTAIAAAQHPITTLQDDDPYSFTTGTLEDPTASGHGYIDGDVLARMAVRSGTRIRPPQAVSEVNGSVGGEKGRAERVEEDEAMLARRREGLRRARHREMVRCAARRGVVFGFGAGSGEEGEGGSRRKCEAVMLGKVVEPSFAKGDWSIRWRE